MKVWYDVVPTYMLGALMLASMLVLTTVLTVVSCWHQIDRGRCLFGHDVRQHRDAYMLCVPTIGVGGDVSMACHEEPEEEWTTTECDQWEFPHGRAERN